MTRYVISSLVMSDENPTGIPGGPNSENQMTEFSPLTRQIANAIADCSAETQVQPQDLTRKVFLSFLKGQKGLDPQEMTRVRDHMSTVGGFAGLLTSFFSGQITRSTVEKCEIREIAKLNRRSTKQLKNDYLFLERFGEVAKGLAVEIKKLPLTGYCARAPKGVCARVVTLALSDLHLGSRMDPRDLPYRFDFKEESRSIASIMVRLNEFKPDHRHESELIIWIGGDLIRGEIHDPGAGRPGAEQSADAMWLLTQAVRLAASEWKKVTVYCSTGNHDRDHSRHPSGAIEDRWDSRATVIYYGIKLATQHLRNVRVEIPRTSQCSWEVFGHRVWADHGDYGFKTGNPAKSINVGKLNTQMQSINLAEVEYGRRPYSVFLAGHIHQGVHIPLPVGELITNPPLVPVDGFARGIGHHRTKSGQVMFESVPGYPVGDLRFQWITPEIMKDKSLDKIIIPFKDF
jgi:hypothetical protein